MSIERTRRGYGRHSKEDDAQGWKHRVNTACRLIQRALIAIRAPIGPSRGPWGTLTNLMGSSVLRVHEHHPNEHKVDDNEECMEAMTLVATGMLGSLS